MQNDHSTGKFSDQTTTGKPDELEFVNLADFVPEFVWICTADGRNIYFNQRWVDYTGLSLEESYGTGWNTPFHPDDQAGAWKAWYKAVQTGELYEIESRIRAADGSYRWFLMRGKPFRDSDGTIHKWFGTCTDIHEFRRTREDLEIGMEAAGLGMWCYDPETGVVIADERMHRIFGSPAPTGAVGYWLDLLHPEDRDRVSHQFAGFLAGDHDYDTEYRIIRNGEVRWVLSRGQAVGPKGKPERLVAILEDITDRKKAATALQQNEKLAAVGRLAASIAHEINNPLESVTNLLYLMRSSSDLDEMQNYLETAERELRRVSLITSQTLRFHRQSTSAAPAFCYDLIGESLAMFQSRIVNNKIEVEKQKRAEQPVQCLGGEIRQVLNNLIGNAIDAMPTGGRLLLRSREADNHRTGKRGLVITVADNGTGMSPEVQKKAFDAFYTTKGIGGTGLGLWISCEIVARHHGELRVRSSSKPGKSGSVFTLFLPFET